MIRPIINARIHKSFGIAAATALVVAIATPGASHAEFRSAGHPAHVNALPRPPMRPLQTGTVVAAPAAQALPPRVVQSAPSVAIGHAEDTGHAGDQGHDRAENDMRDRLAEAGLPSPAMIERRPSDEYSPDFQAHADRRQDPEQAREEEKARSSKRPARCPRLKAAAPAACAFRAQASSS